MASVFAGAAIALGAFGAHALRSRLGERDLEIFETAVRYQFYHALALFVVAGFLFRGVTAASGAGWAFAVGIVIFSGSLYTMVATGSRWLGAITPVGGAAFIAGWIILAVAARRL